MTVYIDQFPDEGWGKWNGGGHLLTTNIGELHRMAKRIGLRRAWFQDGRFPHYDVTRPKRAAAIAAGAVEIEWGYLPDDILQKHPKTDEYVRRDQIRRRPPRRRHADS